MPRAAPSSRLGKQSAQSCFAYYRPHDGRHDHPPTYRSRVPSNLDHQGRDRAQDPAGGRRGHALRDHEGVVHRGQPCHLEMLKPVLGSHNVVVESHESLPFANLPAFMAKLRLRQGIVARGLEFMIITNARRAHIRGVPSAQHKAPRPPMMFKHVDWDERVSTIPGSKMHGEDTVPGPLSDRAFGLRMQDRALNLHPEIVFYSEETDGGELGSRVMLDLARELSGIDTLDAHGFRSTFKTYADEILDYGKDNTVVETCMDHRKVGDSAQEKAYRRGTFFEKQRKLMQEWADYATGSTSIVPLRKAS